MMKIKEASMNELIDEMFRNMREVYNEFDKEPVLIFKEYIAYREAQGSDEYLENELKNMESLQVKMIKRLNEYVDDKRFQSLRHNNKNEADEFIESFAQDKYMTKKSAANLSGNTEAWIYNHIKSDEFKHDKRGVEVRSFLTWLKVYNYHFFATFKHNYA